MRAALGALLAVVVLVGSAEAVPISFSCITGNSAANCGTGEAQLVGTVTDAGPGQVRFTFANTGPVASAISDLYFDDGTLLALSSVENQPGVAFTQWAVPVNLPGGELLAPPFQTTKGFSADSNVPIQINGVNPGESVSILFTLFSGLTLSDTVLALHTGALRIGVQMVAFGDIGQHTCDEGHPCGGAESFVNRPVPVPEASVLALFGFGLVAAGLVVRRIG
jgi:hypothetical protein